MPWSGQASPFGFTDNGATPWLPQPQDWKALTVETERLNPASMLALYHSALAIRRREPSLQSRTFAWEDAPDGVLCYSRGDNVVVLVNLSAEPVPLPKHDKILIASGQLWGRVPPVTAVWLRRK
jgi:alpha-glucosidase